MPTVSIIIPVHNGSRFIAEAIESVLDQTYQDYEIIVVNDGSTDSTYEILRSYQKYIRYIALSSNQGVASARNHGIQIARGELITFLDQDDWFSPGKLMVQVRQFTEKPDLDIITSGWCTTDKNRIQLSNIEPWNSLPQLNESVWIVWKPIFPGALMIRRSLLLQVGKFNNRFQQTSDVDLVLRIMALGCKTDWTREVTVYYRQHDENTSHNVIQQVEELEEVLNSFFKRQDLADTVRNLERRSKYQSLVWSAWKLYDKGCLPEMAAYLEKSFHNSIETRTETYLSWVKMFQQYAKEQGKLVSIWELTQLPQWLELIQRCVSYSH